MKSAKPEGIPSLHKFNNICQLDVDTLRFQDFSFSDDCEVMETSDDDSDGSYYDKSHINGKYSPVYPSLSINVCSVKHRK